MLRTRKLNNNLSDSNISESAAEGNAFYEQYLHDISSGNIDFQPFVEDKQAMFPAARSQTGFRRLWCPDKPLLSYPAKPS